MQSTEPFDAIRPTGGPLGAEVAIDLARDPAPEHIHALLCALQRFHVLLFRNQSLSEARLIEVATWFGPLYQPPPGFPMLGGAEQPAIVKVSNTEPDGVAGSDPLPAHSDLHNMPCPADVAVLYAVEVPERGGETSWSNLQLAYETLDPALRARLVGVRGTSPNPYTGGHAARVRSTVGRAQLYLEQPVPEFAHPVVRTHPVTGRRSLYVGHYVDRLVGVEPPEEADALLAKLKAHVDQDPLYWTHRWRAGELVIWDNRCTNHKRAPLPAGAHRTLWRMAIGGSRPF